MPYVSDARERHLKLINSLPQTKAARFKPKHVNFIRSRGPKGGAIYAARDCGHETQNASSRLCRACYTKQRQPSTPFHERRREQALKRRYGMSIADFERRKAAQGGVCAICKTREAKVVDHDHETGKIRGLLCAACNGAIGILSEDFTNAMIYLGLVEEVQQIAV